MMYGTQERAMDARKDIVSHVVAIVINKKYSLQRSAAINEFKNNKKYLFIYDAFYTGLKKGQVNFIPEK